MVQRKKIVGIPSGLAICVCFRFLPKCTTSVNVLYFKGASELRSISAENKKKFKFVPKNAAVCLKCRIAIGKYEPSNSENKEGKTCVNIDEKEKLNIALTSLDEIGIDYNRYVNKFRQLS